MDTITRSVPFTLTRSGEGDGLTLAGYAAVFNSPTLIRGEGPDFDEVIAPGAFARTIQAKTPVLMFNHGQHPLVGDMPLGSITKLKEDARGLYIEARLASNWLIEPVRDAIASGAVDGMSFRFSVPKGKDEWDRTGDIPLRTLREVNCVELGPVVFPAYSDTSVAVRSLVDHLDSDTKATFVDYLSEDRAVDPDEAEDNAAMAIIAQIKPLVGQLVALEGESLQAGEDVSMELNMLVGLISSLDCYEDMNDPANDGTEDAPMSGMYSADPSDTPTELAADGTSYEDSSRITADPQPDSTPPPLSAEAARLRLLKLKRTA